MIGERLRLLRVRAGLSQQELAERLCVSHHSVSAYEKGRSDPPDEVKLRLARYFDVSVDYLLGLVEEPVSFARTENTLYLPGSLSESDRAEIEDFAEFLHRRSTQIN